MKTTEPKHKCEKMVFSDYRHCPCRNNASVEREGKWYCGIHDPEKIKKKREEQDKRWEEKYKERSEYFNRRAAEKYYCKNLDTKYLENHIAEK